MLSPDVTYRLPDGTRVRAVEPLIGPWRLDLEDGTPAYLYDAVLGAWRRLVYDAAIDGYAVLPCDLVDEDLKEPT